MTTLREARLDWSARQVAIPTLLAIPGPPGHDAVLRVLRGPTMGTTWSVTLACPRANGLRELEAAIEARLAGLVAEMSTWLDTSDIARFNASAGEWRDLPSDFATVLACALRVAAESGGAYDATVGPLVDLWGFGPRGARRTPPRDAEVAAARARCGWRQIEIDGSAGRARQPGGVAVDLSAIAKGYAVDALARVLDAHGVASYLVEIGGELRGRGMKPDGQPWWVSVERPSGAAARDDSDAPYDMVIALHDLSVATSSDYRRGFASGGRWFSHTIDPRTGSPVTHELTSVTVLHRECMLADAWSTALTVLGPVDGMRTATALDLPALFVTRTATGFAPSASSALLAMLE